MRDHLSSHQRASTIRAIEAAGVEVACLPPCSRDLHPIENVFSKIQNRLRSRVCRLR
ncbi:MAG: transposase [Planctomycetota bacterium]